MTSPWPTGLFVDTGGFFAFMVRKDEHYVEANRILRQVALNGQAVFTSNFVVAETHALLVTRRHREEEARLFLRTMMAGAVPIIRVTEADEQAAYAIIEQYVDKDFSLTDATSFAIMRRLGISVALAFDRHFVQFGFQRAGVDR